MNLAFMEGMAEMTLMKMGDLLDMPHKRRVALAQKAAEEQKSAVTYAHAHAHGQMHTCACACA